MPGSARATRRAARAALAVLVLVVSARGLRAQAARASRLQPELRADAFAGDPWAAHLGAGVGIRLGFYARLQVAAGVGTSGGGEGGDDPRTSGRVEVLGRFVVDPYRERRVGLYAAAGLVQRLEVDARPRTRLTAVLGAEGRPWGGVIPSLEAGFGGGVRVGLVLRRTRPDGR